MFIRTENLLLRPSWPDDLDDFVALINDERVSKNIGAKSLPGSVEVARDIIARPREKLLPHFFIGLRTDAGLNVIGSIGLGRDGSDVELGYWIAAQYWGLGYASEATAAMLDHAWMLGHQRILAIHFAGNEATGRVLAKAGFAPTGETRMRQNIVTGKAMSANVYAATCPDIARPGGGMAALMPQPV